MAGSAIVFATVVNAGGFLALALADLPPMRQFGGLTATAFALSMLADFTALPAALWLVFRERPEGSSNAGRGDASAGPIGRAPSPIQGAGSGTRNSSCVLTPAWRKPL